MKAIILTGLPCSGKSTVSNILLTSLFEDWALVSPDSFMESFCTLVDKQVNHRSYVSYNTLYNDGWFQEAEKLAWGKHLRHSILKGRGVILDDVNLSKASRKKLLGYLKGYVEEFNIKEMEIHNVFVDTDLETCKLRDKHRCEATGKCIPESEFERLFNLLETPTESEGFDKVWHVKDYDVTHLSTTLQGIVSYIREDKN